MADVKGFLVHSTSAYTLHRDTMGNYTITRLHDGLDCYFQGDDAMMIDEIANIPYVAGGIWDNDSQFNRIMSRYDSVMS